MKYFLAIYMLICVIFTLILYKKSNKREFSEKESRKITKMAKFSIFLWVAYGVLVVIFMINN